MGQGQFGSIMRGWLGGSARGLVCAACAWGSGLACAPSLALAQRAVQIDAITPEPTSQPLPEPQLVPARIDPIEPSPLPLRPPTFPDSGLTLESIRFGWNNTLLAERQTPVWVRVRSGETPAAGYVSIEYAQDASQRAQVVAPFATTPGQATTVELLICVPRQTESLRITISDGEVTRTLEAGALAGDRGVTMPVVLADCLGIVALNAGAARHPVSSLGLGLKAMPLDYNQALSDTHARNNTYAGANVASIAPASMPVSWVAYESVDAFIAREEDLATAPPRALDALHAWVLSGGHLILQVGSVGQTWRQVAPPGVSSEIVFAERGEGPTPERLTTNVVPRTQPQRRASWSPDVPVLDRGGSNPGWVALFVGRQDATLLDGPDISSPIVHGPVGLGKLTLVGLDLSRSSSPVTDESAGYAWRSMLTSTIPVSLFQALASDEPNDYYKPSSGARRFERDGLRGVLDATTFVAPVGLGFFVIAALAVLTLLLCVGPLGRIILRRQGWLRSSWIIVVLLTLVTCVVAALSPRLVRSGQTQASVLHVDDIVIGEEGELLAHARTSVRGVFSGKPESIDIAGRGTPPTEGQWWRGISSAPVHNAVAPLGDPLTLVLTQPAPGIARSAAPLPVSLGQWTYRAFLAQDSGWVPPQDGALDAPGASARATPATSPPTLRAQVRANDAGTPTIRVRGLDASDRLLAAWLFTSVGSSRCNVATHPAVSPAGSLSPNESGVIEVEADDQSLPQRLRATLAVTGVNGANYWNAGLHAPSQSQEPLPWYAGLLPGVAQRTDSLALRLGPEGVAPRRGLIVLALREDGPQGTPARDATTPTDQFRVVRMLVPLDDSARESTARMHHNTTPSAAPATPATPPQEDPD